MRILERAYRCHGFDGPCNALTWDPATGHAPRGFGGATGTPGDVQIVLVATQPPPPNPEDSLEIEATPFGMIETICHRTYLRLSERRDQYHSNLRFILDQFFPGHPFEEQMRRSWITQSVLCSVPGDDDMPPAASRECRQNYLDRELELFANARVLALGIAAQKRLKGYPGLIEAGDPAPPGCNQRGVRESWTTLGARFAGS